MSETWRPSEYSELIVTFRKPVWKELKDGYTMVDMVSNNTQGLCGATKGTKMCQENTHNNIVPPSEAWTVSTRQFMLLIPNIDLTIYVMDKI